MSVVNILFDKYTKLDKISFFKIEIEMTISNKIFVNFIFEN